MSDKRILETVLPSVGLYGYRVLGCKVLGAGTDAEGALCVRTEYDGSEDYVLIYVISAGDLIPPCTTFVNTFLDGGRIWHLYSC